MDYDNWAEAVSADGSRLLYIAARLSVRHDIGDCECRVGGDCLGKYAHRYLDAERLANAKHWALSDIRTSVLRKFRDRASKIGQYCSPYEKAFLLWLTHRKSFCPKCVSVDYCDLMNMEAIMGTHPVWIRLMDKVQPTS